MASWSIPLASGEHPLNQLMLTTSTSSAIAA
jgi:hypothetical protein